MGVNERIMPNQKSTGVLGLTGAAPQTGGSAATNIITMSQVETSTLSAKVYAKATTNTLTITAKWQVSDGGASPTWEDCAGTPNNAANVALVTGTGVAVTSTIHIPAPSCVYGKRFARIVVVTGVGVGGGAGVDEYSIAYDYRQPNPLAG